VDIRNLFFTYRSYTPIPLILLALVLADPSWMTFLGGVAVMILGEAVRFWGVAYAGSATRTTATAGGERLVTDGPFGHVRNPLYAGNFFLSLGVMIMCWPWMPWMALIYLLLFFLQYGCIVNLEEEYLSKRFGEAYTRYCANVGRWIPRLKGYKDGEVSSPNYAKALKSEKNTLQAIFTIWVLVLLRWHLLG
jgi:protein-S-isoprenylcysteine O-methyltransferase Ste14